MKKKIRTELSKATLASVRQELARPRMASSVREAGLGGAGRKVPAAQGDAELKLRRVPLLRRAK